MPPILVLTMASDGRFRPNHMCLVVQVVAEGGCREPVSYPLIGLNEEEDDDMPPDADDDGGDDGGPVRCALGRCSEQ